MTKKLLTILFFLGACLYAQEASATRYYVNETAGWVNGNGLATTTAFNNLDAFTEAARTAGDIAYVRRVATTTARASDLDFTSDGTIANPIIIQGDYDNLWSDFSTSTQTYTVTIGADTMTGSASITGIAAGDWIYVEGDCFENYGGATTGGNTCEFAYEVSDVVGTVLHLYLPYKGNQSGAGLSLRRMPPNPQWNIASGDFQWNFDTDDYWMVKGMDIRGTDANGNVEIDSSVGHWFYDMVLISDDTGGGIETTDDIYSIIASKLRVLGTVFTSNTGDTYGQASFKNAYVVAGTGGNGITALAGATPVFALFNLNDVSIFNASRAISLGTSNSGGIVLGRNIALKGSTAKVSLGNTTMPTVKFVNIDDYDRTIGSSRQISPMNTVSDTDEPFLLSTTTLRSGGGPTSIEVRPTTNTTSIWDFNNIKLFDYPVYTDTSSKQYDVYFRNATSTEFTANPTASELWIQCEYWAHATNATSTRKVKKSTGTLNLTGSTDWQALSVTCQPTQTGVMYLSGWYAKTKEAGQSNVIIIDGTPVIQ